MANGGVRKVPNLFDLGGNMDTFWTSIAFPMRPSLAYTTGSLGPVLPLGFVW